MNKIKLVPLWPDREQQKLKQIEKVLSKEVIEGDLDLSGSPIQNIGDIRHVKGNLNLHGCWNLLYLPEGLIVDGSLIISYCVRLTKLPKGLVINHKFYYANCGIKYEECALFWGYASGHTR